MRNDDAIWDIGKFNVYDKIMIENQKKRQNMKIEDIFT